MKWNKPQHWRDTKALNKWINPGSHYKMPSVTDIYVFSHNWKKKIPKVKDGFYFFNLYYGKSQTYTKLPTEGPIYFCISFGIYHSVLHVAEVNLSN